MKSEKVNFIRHKNINENRGALSLYGDKQNQDSTVSTLGLRAYSEIAMLTLNGGFGWQHHSMTLSIEVHL